MGGFTQAPLQSPLLHNPSPETPSPAELARVIHVWARLDVAFFWVVDGGGSGVSSSQDEHKAVEGDSWCILVVCEDGRAGGQSQWSWPPSSLFPSTAPNDWRQAGDQEQAESWLACPFLGAGFPAVPGLWDYLLPTVRPGSVDSLG